MATRETPTSSRGSSSSPPRVLALCLTWYLLQLPALHLSPELLLKLLLSELSQLFGVCVLQ